MTSHKRDKCNVLTGHGYFLCSVQKTFTSTSPHFHNLKNICTHTHTHLFGCSVASTIWEEKSNIIFPFEPHFVVQWNHNSAFYKITAKRDNVMQGGLKSTWTWGSHGDHWWLLSLEMWHIVLWKQGTISEEDWYLIFHTTHIPKESSFQCRICLKITRICGICTH